METRWPSLTDLGLVYFWLCWYLWFNGLSISRRRYDNNIWRFITWEQLPWIPRNLLLHFCPYHMPKISPPGFYRLCCQSHCRWTESSTHLCQSIHCHLCQEVWTSSSGFRPWKVTISLEMKPKIQYSLSCHFCQRQSNPSKLSTPSFQTSCPHLKEPTSIRQYWWNHHD